MSSLTLTPQQIMEYKKYATGNKGTEMIVSKVFPLVAAFIFVALRFHARRRSATPIGADDWLILSATILLTAYAILCWIMISYGEGQAIIYATNLPGFFQGIVASFVLYCTTLICTKISILCFYQRIFPSRALTWTCWILGTVVVCYNVALILVAALECIPLSTLWTGEPGKCIHLLVPYMILGSVDVITDIVILALPIRYVFNLNMRRVRKYQVMGIFLLGGVVCVFAIVRVVMVHQLTAGDETYTAVDSSVWCFLENAVGIIAACLPTIGMFCTKTYMPHLPEFVRRWLCCYCATRRPMSVRLPRHVDLGYPSEHYRTWSEVSYAKESSELSSIQSPIDKAPALAHIKVRRELKQESLSV